MYITLISFFAMRAKLGIWAVAALLAVAVTGPAAAQQLDPQVLWDGTWVCSSPEAYTTGLRMVEDRQGKSFGELKAELLKQKLCMYVDGDDVEDMMAPFVTIHDRHGDIVKVSFTIEFYKKIEFLHRNITRVTFNGWTKESSLRNYYDWLRNG